MYEQVFQFFALRENPFHISPDPRFFFSTAAHNSALTELTMGVDTRQGFMVLIGEAGTGKTIVLQRFLAWLHARRQSSCYLSQSQLNTAELLDAILTNFDVACDSRRVSDMLAAFSEWLLRRHATGDSPVVIIDEAQAISLRTLERLRMLLNLEKPGTKLLQLILAGQPELDEKLHRPELRQLHQRIVFRCKLTPLSLEETREYVKSRLIRGGAQTTDIFPDASLEAVHVSAQGIPRVVNLLCEHALLTAYAEHQRTITPAIVNRVATNIELCPQSMMHGEQQFPRYFPQLIPARKDENAARASLKSAALASYMEGTLLTSATLPDAKPEIVLKSEPNLVIPPPTSAILPEAKPTVMSKSDPSLMSTEPLAFAAVVASHHVAPTSTSVASTFAPAPKLRKQEPPKRTDPNPLLPRIHRPNLFEQTFRYCRDVGRSFVRDWKDFLKSLGTPKKMPGSTSSRG